MHAPYRFVLSALIILSLPACKKETVDPRTKAPVVRTMTAPGAKTATQAFTGVVAARVQSNLGFRVPGKIIERLVDTGQIVKAGQPLMRIDGNDLTLTIKARQESVRAAKAQVVEAAADEARNRTLLQSGAVSVKAYDRAKAAADTARAALRAAEAEAEIARNEGDYSLLVADADGTIIETLVEPGQIVAAGQTVVKLARVGPREAAVDLPETLRPALGSTAEASLYGSDDRSKAQLRQLSGSADPQTRTFEARYVLNEDMAQAPLGSTVTIYIEGEKNEEYMEIPLAALTDHGQGPGVWIVKGEDPAISFQPVQVSSLTDETAILKGGLSPSDRIVAIGAHLLHEGQKVSIATSGVSE